MHYSNCAALRSVMIRSWCWLAVCALFITPIAWSETLSLDQIKAVMEGNWRLEESLDDNELLHPPQADGRMSIHGGVIMISMHREVQSTRKSFYGYGTYAFTPEAWSYGFDRYVSFTDTGTAITMGGAPFNGQRNYRFKNEGEKIIADFDNGVATFVFEGDKLTFLGKGKPVRKWRKISTE